MIIFWFFWDFIQFAFAAGGVTQRIAGWVAALALLYFAFTDNTKLKGSAFVPDSELGSVNERVFSWQLTVGQLTAIGVGVIWVAFAAGVTFARFQWLEICGVQVQTSDGHRRIRVRNHSSSPVEFSAKLIEISPPIKHHPQPFLQITGSQRPYQKGVIEGKGEGAVDVFVPLGNFFQIGLLVVNNDSRDLPFLIPRAGYQIRVHVFAVPPSKSAPASADFYIVRKNDWEDDIVPVPKAPIHTTIRALTQFFVGMLLPTIGLVFGGVAGLAIGGLITVAAISLINQSTENCGFKPSS